MTPVTERHGLGLVETPETMETLETAQTPMEAPEDPQTKTCSPLSTSPKSKEKEGEVDSQIQTLETQKGWATQAQKKNYN